MELHQVVQINLEGQSSSDPVINREIELFLNKAALITSDKKTQHRVFISFFHLLETKALNFLKPLLLSKLIYSL